MNPPTETVNVPMSTAEAQAIQKIIRRDNQAWVYRIISGCGGLLVTVLVGYFWLYSDKHNDARYVGKIEYANNLKDAQAKVSDTAKDLASRTLDLANSVAEQNRLRASDHDKLTEIGTDIRWLKEQKQKEISR